MHSQPTQLRDDELDPLLNDPTARAWIVAGYLLRSTATTEPLGLLADLVYTFGFALWTAAVVVVLLEVIPEVKRRQIRRALEACDETRRDKARPKDST